MKPNSYEHRPQSASITVLAANIGGAMPAPALYASGSGRSGLSRLVRRQLSCPAVGGLEHGLPGDASLFGLRDIDAFLAGGSGVRR